MRKTTLSNKNLEKSRLNQKLCIERAHIFNGSEALTIGGAVKLLMIVLTCIMIAAFAYVISIHGLTSCFNLQARWAIVLLANVSIYVVVIAAWFVYKESSWIMTIIFVVLLLTIGSVATCGYILYEFYNLSPEKSSKDPVYFVLSRRQKRDVTGHIRGPSVVTARVIFFVLGCWMLGAIIYTIIGDLSPSRSKFAKCFFTYLIDVYIHAVILSVWIVYKEPSRISAFLWILSLLCLGNITTCVYMLRQLFYLSPQQPVSLVIFSNNRDMPSSDPLLTE